MWFIDSKQHIYDDDDRLSLEANEDVAEIECLDGGKSLQLMPYGQKAAVNHRANQRSQLQT